MTCTSMVDWEKSFERRLDHTSSYAQHKGLMEQCELHFVRGWEASDSQ